MIFIRMLQSSLKRCQVKMKSIAIFCLFIATCVSAQLVTKECWKSVLSGNANDECTKSVEKSKESFVKKFLATAETDAKREFFKKSMQEFEIPEIYAKILAFHSTSGTNESETEEIVDRFSDSINGVFSILQMSDDEVFSVFNRVYNRIPVKTPLAAIDTETTCKLNYLIEQSVIRVDDYGFELPHVDASECAEVYDALKKRDSEPRFAAAIHIPGTPSDKVNECIRDKHSGGRWMLYDESFEILSRLDLGESEEKLRKFKQNYSQWFKSKFRGILECLRKMF